MLKYHIVSKASCSASKKNPYISAAVEHLLRNFCSPDLSRKLLVGIQSASESSLKKTTNPTRRPPNLRGKQPGACPIAHPFPPKEGGILS